MSLPVLVAVVDYSDSSRNSHHDNQQPQDLANDRPGFTQEVNTMDSDGVEQSVCQVQIGISHLNLYQQFFWKTILLFVMLFTSEMFRSSSSAESIRQVTLGLGGLFFAFALRKAIIPILSYQST